MVLVRSSEFTREKIDIPKKKFLIFDVDDTVCHFCQPMSSKMAHKIDQLIENGITVAFLSSTGIKGLKEMVSSQLTRKHHLLPTLGASYTYVNEGVHSQVYCNPLSTEEKKEIITALDKIIKQFNLIPLTSREDQVLDRTSQITFSTLGRNAPLDIKRNFDPNQSKRKEWVRILRQDLDKDKYSIAIGGTTSIDINKKLMSKEWGLKTFASHHNINLDNILFVGDSFHKHGNDYPASKIVDCIWVEGPNDTLSFLNRLFPLPITLPTASQND